MSLCSWGPEQLGRSRQRDPADWSEAVCRDLQTCHFALASKLSPSQCSQKMTNCGIPPTLQPGHTGMYFIKITWNRTSLHWEQQAVSAVKGCAQPLGISPENCTTCGWDQGERKRVSKLGLQPHLHLPWGRPRNRLVLTSEVICSPYLFKSPPLGYLGGFCDGSGYLKELSQEPWRTSFHAKGVRD